VKKILNKKNVREGEVEGIGGRESMNRAEEGK
jgi:hypothetical protein